jgi:tRNA dimethylallyltransferase
MANRTAYFLVGSTAVGKTAVAHWIARKESFEVLSADSMLVYKGMDIGTAKPDPIARTQVRYHGIDITSPNQSSNLAQWLGVADEAFRNAQAPLIVTGGTGLYMRSLVEGLAEGPPPNSEKRARWEALYEERGLGALQEMLCSKHPDMYASLADPENPRRLIRALEFAEAGIRTRPEQWDARPSHSPFVGLSMKPPLLHSRIETRIREMYRGGLLEEVARLTDTYPTWSDTARQAIGYAEAVAVRNGDMTLEDAIEKSVTRTRQLAKRQRTWFNHQANVEWLDVESSTHIEEVGNRVRDAWNTIGPTEIKRVGETSNE